MTTDLKALSSSSVHSISSPSQNKSGPAGTLTISLKDLSNVYRSNPQFKKTTIILTNASGQRFSLTNGVSGNINMAGSSQHNGSNSSTNNNHHKQNNSHYKNLNQNNKILINSNTIEMMNAIEELRRENERITNELGATQDLLDLFEQYRDLVQEHMRVCICQGKDHLWSRWNQYEQDYKRMLPIKRFEPQLATSQENRLNSLNNIGTKSNYEVMTASERHPKINKKIIPIKCETTKINGNFKYVGTLSSNEIIVHDQNEKFDVTLKMVNEENNHGNGKSLVRSFLDKIRPITLASNQDVNKPVQQQQSHPVSIISQGSNVLIRKRSSLHDIPFRSHPIIKKLKNSHLQTNNKKKNQDHSADQEVERLDKLNNALDQILMGRFDALTQLETYVVDNNNNNGNHDYEEMEIDEDGIIDGEDEEPKTNDSKKTFPGNLILNDQIVNNDNTNNCMEETEDSDSDSDENDDQEDDDEVILLNPNNDISREVNDNNNNNKKKSESSSNSPSSTILSTVLKSGLKPYSNYHQAINVNEGRIINNVQPLNKTVQTSKVNTARIQIYPTTVMLSSGATPSLTKDSNGIVFSNLVNKQKTNVITPQQQTSYPQPCLQKRPHLTNEERMDIINRLKRNESGARIARDYGITKQAVSAIKRRAQLMGDNFQTRYYLTPGNGSTNGTGSRNHSPTPMTYSKLSTISQQQPTIKGATTTNNNNKASVSINLAMTPVSSSFDNSLVSRQLKQQKVNATIIKQSNLLAQLPRSTSDLVLPVNPVAIIKSQMAAQQQNSTTKLENKRLILPRLLQGTETYTPTYVTAAAAAVNREKNVDDKTDENHNFEKNKLKISKIDDGNENDERQAENSSDEQDIEDHDQDDQLMSPSCHQQQLGDGDDENGNVHQNSITNTITGEENADETCGENFIIDNNNNDEISEDEYDGENEDVDDNEEEHVKSEQGEEISDNNENINTENDGNQDQNNDLQQDEDDELSSQESSPSFSTGENSIQLLEFT